MRYGLIYKTSFNRSKSMEFDTESPFQASTSLDARSFLVEHLVDFDERTITPVALKSDGTLLEIPEGDFGEGTTTEYLEEMVSTMPAPEPEVSTMEEAE
jgi:hypothetical protein